MSDKMSLLKVNMKYEEPIYGLFENKVIDMLAAGILPNGKSASRISGLDPNVVVIFDCAEELQPNLFRALESTKMTYLDRISSFDVVERNVYVDTHNYIAKEIDND